MGLLDESRIPISLIPERLIAEVAAERGIDLAAAEVEPARDGAPLVGLDPAVLPVFDAALRHFRGVSWIWVHLPFTMQRQEQLNWCWAAVATSLAHYYVSWSVWRQCEVVNMELGETTCCVDGSTPQCDKGHNFEAALNRTEVLDHAIDGTVDLGTIGEEVDHGRPLGVNIQWSGGGGHLIVIDGYSRLVGDPWVAINDPWSGSSDLALAELAGGSFQGSGTWAQTYFTKAPPFPFVLPEEKVLLPEPIWARVLAAEPEPTPRGAA